VTVTHSKMLISLSVLFFVSRCCSTCSRGFQNICQSRRAEQQLQVPDLAGHRAAGLCRHHCWDSCKKAQHKKVHCSMTLPTGVMDLRVLLMQFCIPVDIVWQVKSKALAVKHQSICATSAAMHLSPAGVSCQSMTMVAAKTGPGGARSSRHVQLGSRTACTSWAQPVHCSRGTALCCSAGLTRGAA
jgi:hypothetical protein